MNSIHRNIYTTNKLNYLNNLGHNSVPAAL